MGRCGDLHAPVASIEDLIAPKDAAGRPQDIADAAAPRALRECLSLAGAFEPKRDCDRLITWRVQLAGGGLTGGPHPTQVTTDASSLAALLAAL
ncbi:MAG: hypothetical protein ACYDAQ_19455 [Mycobacteriales bacterium]